MDRLAGDEKRIISAGFLSSQIEDRDIRDSEIKLINTVISKEKRRNIILPELDDLENVFENNNFDLVNKYFK